MNNFDEIRTELDTIGSELTTLRQRRLPPRLEPIAAPDGLSYEDLAPGYAYRCRCGNEVTTRTPLESIVCTKCGSAMQPSDDALPRGRDPPHRL